MKNIFLITVTVLVFSLTKGYSQLPVKEGKDGVYIYLSDRRLSEQSPVENIIGVSISRAVGNEKEFKLLGRAQAALTREDFLKTAGNGILKNVMELKELKTEEQAWEYIKVHPELSDYGLLLLNPDFSVAMGAVFKDVEAKNFPGKVIRYRAEYITRDGKREKPLEFDITLGKSPLIEKPIVDKIQETDSTLLISWKADYEKSPDAVLGEIWKREKANAEFKLTGYAIANRAENGKEIIFNWNQSVTPGLSYGFYIVPVTLAHLPGPKSDTTHLISRTFPNLPQIPIASINDTLGGIQISWEKVSETPLISGIVVERSKNPSDGFILLDTIPAVSTSYRDVRILPNTLYHYRFRTLGLRQDISEPSAYVSHQLVVKGRPVEAPEKVELTHDKDGNIQLRWKRVNSPEIGGYQVFRTTQGSDLFEPISNLLSDSVFTDTTIRNSRQVYKYIVKTLNYENQPSLPSASVFGSPAKTIPPKAPLNVESYSEPGKITLRWKDMLPFDEFIQGYSIYRKEATLSELSSEKEISVSELRALGYGKITPMLLSEVMFSDNTVQNGKSYLYAVTSTDLFGIESTASGTMKIKNEAYRLRAPEIFARNTSRGIEITWTDILEPKADVYEVYVRLPNEKTARKLKDVGSGQEVFVDSGARSGQLYFYSLKAKAKGNESALGNEKSVLKK